MRGDQVMKNTRTADWSIKPNEAYDMVLFLNAISKNDFYNQHYQGVREHRSKSLGERGIELVDSAVSVISMSALCRLLSKLAIQTLDDIIYRLRNWEETALVFESTEVKFDLQEMGLDQDLRILSENKVLILACFEQLKATEIDENWRRNISPHIQDVAEQLQGAMSALYPYEKIRQTVSLFLGRELPLATYQVFFATYIKPIAFTLSNQAMVTHQGPPGYMPIPKQIATLCIHESLHGFPETAEAQKEQEQLRRRDEAFNEQYLNIVQKWRSGPEEFFVVGAEAYLTEVLQIRTHKECITYLETQNGGMPLSLEIYKRLREERPEQNSDWMGYGYWLLDTMKERDLVSS